MSERIADLVRQMFFNAGPKAEVRTRPGEHDCFQVCVGRESFQRQVKAKHHGLIQDVGLGRGQGDPRDLALMRELKPDFVLYNRVLHGHTLAISAFAVHGATSSINSSPQRAKSSAVSWIE